MVKENDVSDKKSKKVEFKWDEDNLSALENAIIDFDKLWEKEVVKDEFAAREKWVMAFHPDLLDPLSPARLAMAGETLEALATRAPWEKSVGVTFEGGRSVDKPWFIRCGGLRTGLIGGGYSFAEAATKIVDPLKDAP